MTILYIMSETKVKENDTETIQLYESVKTNETSIKPPEPQVIERNAKGCVTCSKTAVVACKCCIGCWRCTLNLCEALMDINIRCCTCTKACLERIDCDETP